ncbi:alpha/beta fold hydrolase [Microlunatus sp. GCM10028923]|uniref:alpha/beta fold hydrolase n=1 Tax=Microlunatus sp. GCM10028923 TaxID=3273400 RepID=UPI00361B1FB6
MTDLQRGLDTVDQWFLPSDGFDLYVREIGSGPPVIAVHGGPGVEHSELVEPLLPLTERHRVLWYDQRGSIRSPYSDLDQLESITFDAHVGDLIRLAEEVGPASVVAHSYGTLIMMTALRRRPELFRSIVLTGAIPATGFNLAGRDRWNAERGGLAAARIAELGLDRDDLSARESQLRWRIGFAAFNAVAEDAWLTLRWPGRSWNRQDVAHLGDRGCPETFDYTVDLVSHPHPVTVIMGDSDYADLGLDTWRSICAAHPSLGLRVLERCGHSPWYDRPELFRTELLAAFAQPA